jgi:hypothetical protein
VITETKVVKLPVPVIEKIDPGLIQDCEPKYLYPKDSMTVEAITDRVAAVEDALAICRNDKALIRYHQGKAGPEQK